MPSLFCVSEGGMVPCAKKFFWKTLHIFLFKLPKGTWCIPPEVILYVIRFLINMVLRISSAALRGFRLNRPHPRVLVECRVC